MGGRGHFGNVIDYLNFNKRTSEYGKIDEISTDEIDFIYDKMSPEGPVE